MSINTLNLSGLNLPIKRHRLARWIKKKIKTQTLHPTTDSIQIYRHTQALLKVWKDISVGNQQKAGVAIQVSDKIDFRPKTVTRDKEAHYICSSGTHNNYKSIPTQHWNT